MHNWLHLSTGKLVIPNRGNDKCSRKVYLEFRTISVEQNFQLRIDGSFRPRRESPPVVLEVLPYDLDEIQFGTVRRQIKQECFVFDEPAVQCDLIDPVMNARIVEHDHGRS